VEMIRKGRVGWAAKGDHRHTQPLWPSSSVSPHELVIAKPLWRHNIASLNFATKPSNCAFVGHGGPNNPNPGNGSDGRHRPQLYRHCGRFFGGLRDPKITAAVPAGATTGFVTVAGS
jgi:hypothetical protein